MVIERTIRATLDELWDRWTTAAGIESWWGADGFLLRVNRLEVRPGGVFEYATKAIEPAQIAALNSAALPPTSRGKGAATDARPPARPPDPPCEVSPSVEFKKVPGGVRVVGTQDEMHNTFWTHAAAMGLDQQIDRLESALSGRAQE